MQMRTIQFLTMGAGICISLGACTYPIQYRLNDRDIIRASSPKSMKVQVAIFTDNRASAEREKSARKKSGDLDVNDYTYDKEFSASVNKAISQMLVKHLAFSSVFESISLHPLRAAQITDAVLDSLAQTGIDAVMIGEIDNFYGYYDQHPGAEAAYSIGLALALAIPVAIATTTTETRSFGPGIQAEEVKTNPLAISLATFAGLSLGSYLESSAKRRIEHCVKLSVNIVDTKRHSVLWNDVLVVEEKKIKAMPGIETTRRKYEIVVASLRTAINEMVKRLGEAQFTTSTQ